MKKHKPITLAENMLKAREAQKQKHGEDYPDVMADRGRRSYEAQLLKYGGKEGYSAEMKRRHGLRNDLKDTEEYNKLEEEV
jgi:hypothetical protein